MDRIFISYSRKDTDFVRKLAGDLETAGYRPWWDVSDLEGGDDWVRKIPDAIASSQYFIVVLTPASIESEWVRKEYTQALTLRKKIIPILLTPCNIPFALNTINFVNFAVGEYADNFKRLLSPLGYTGKPPAVTPYKKPLLSIPAFKYGIPSVVGLILLLAYIFIRGNTPTEETPTVTSTPTLAALPTATNTPEPVIPSDIDTATATTVTVTYTSVPPTPLTTPIVPTLPQAFSLPICIYIYDGPPVNVRAGPNIAYTGLGKLEPDGNNCPFFSTVIKDKLNETWFQLALIQKVEFEEYAGKWLSGGSLAVFDLRGLPLPICIYHRDGTNAEVRKAPRETAELQEDPLKADGTNCPFFDTRELENDLWWYRLAPDQRGKDEFKDYAGGWIREDFLVIHTVELPAVTLTPTFAPNSTPTFTPTLTPSSTATATNIPTETATP